MEAKNLNKFVKKKVREFYKFANVPEEIKAPIPEIDNKAKVTELSLDPANIKKAPNPILEAKKSDSCEKIKPIILSLKPLPKLNDLPKPCEKYDDFYEKIANNFLSSSS